MNDNYKTNIRNHCRSRIDKFFKNELREKNPQKKDAPMLENEGEANSRMQQRRAKNKQKRERWNEKKSRKKKKTNKEDKKARKQENGIVFCNAK